MRALAAIKATRDFSRFQELLALIQTSFAYMRGAIDPPSSAERLSADALAAKAMEEILLIVEDAGALAGCAFAAPRQDHLYLGKIAVASDRQGQGIGRLLLDAAAREARSRGLHQLRLETRVELIENHKTFEAWGFQRIGENSHPGFTRATSFTYAKAL